jgi:glutaredoxin-like protein
VLRREKIGLINQKDAKYLSEYFNNFKNPVTVLYFNSEKVNPEYCDSTLSILNEITQLSENVKIETHSIDERNPMAAYYDIITAPAIAIQSDTDVGIRYYGIPSGYEFSTLINSITIVGNGNVNLPDFVQENSKLLTKKMEIMVFVTPSCPRCPRAAIMANKLAFTNENITSKVIEANEFPELTKKYSVMAVPKTIINEEHSFEGIYGDEHFMNELIKYVRN